MVDGFDADRLGAEGDRMSRAFRVRVLGMHSENDDGERNNGRAVGGIKNESCAVEMRMRRMQQD
jgi:hypothetical protein